MHPSGSNLSTPGRGDDAPECRHREEAKVPNRHSGFAACGDRLPGYAHEDTLTFTMVLAAVKLSRRLWRQTKQRPRRLQTAMRGRARPS